MNIPDVRKLEWIGLASPNWLALVLFVGSNSGNYDREASQTQRNASLKIIRSKLLRKPEDN